MLNKTLHTKDILTLLIILIIVFVWSLVYMMVLDNSFWINKSIGLKILGAFFYVMLFLTIQFVIRKNKLNTNSYLTIFIIFILTLAFPQVLQLNHIILSFFFHVLMLHQLLRLNHVKNVALPLLNAGLLSGVSFILFPNSLIFILLIYVAYFVFVRIIDRHIIIPLIGFVVPVFLFYIYLFSFNGNLFHDAIFEIELNPISSILANTSTLISLIFFSLITFIGSLVFLRQTLLITNTDFQKYKLYIPSFLLGLVVVLISYKNQSNSIIFLLFPMAGLIFFLFSTIQKYRVKEALLWLIVLVSIHHFFL